jgi:hypothetical protein
MQICGYILLVGSKIKYSERGQSEDLGLDGRIILERILGK